MINAAVGIVEIKRQNQKNSDHWQKAKSLYDKLNKLNKLNKKEKTMNTKQTYLTNQKSLLFYSILVATFLLIPGISLADVFDNVNTKGNEIVAGLRNIAVVIATIAIMVVAFMMYKGRIGNQMAFGVIIGSIVLGAATEIAELLIN